LLSVLSYILFGGLVNDLNNSETRQVLGGRGGRGVSSGRVQNSGELVRNTMRRGATACGMGA
jgi:hypothetical protein